MMESLGHVVIEGGPERLFDESFLEHVEIDYASRMFPTCEAIWKKIGRDFGEGEVEPYTWARMERVREISAKRHIEAQIWLQAWTARIISWWEDFDLLLTPSTGEPPATLEELEVDPSDPFEIDLRRFARIRCFVRPFNVTGQPAISLPLHMTAEGLPIGVQLVAAPYREDLLIRVASQIEAAAPWEDRRPTL
jgi:amidase